MSKSEKRNEISKPHFPPPGLLISFDGLDSTGKATQTKRLVDRLRYHGYAVQEFSTPDYATESGQDLKRRLQNKDGTWDKTPWQGKLRLFAANRAEHRPEVVSALATGTMVVYDRYVPSSLAFIATEGLPAQKTDLFSPDIWRAVEREEYDINKMPHEDVSIFLDVPPNIGSALLDSRKDTTQDADEYTDHLHVQERLYNEYDLMMKQQPERFVRIACVEGTQLLGIDDIAELVWESLITKFPLLKERPVD